MSLDVYELYGNKNMPRLILVNALIAILFGCQKPTGMTIEIGDPKAMLVVVNTPKPQLRGMILQYEYAIWDRTLDKANYRIGSFDAKAVYTLNHIEEFINYPQMQARNGRFVAVYLDKDDDSTLIKNLPMPLEEYTLIQTITDKNSGAITSKIILHDDIVYLP